MSCFQIVSTNSVSPNCNTTGFCTHIDRGTDTKGERKKKKDMLPFSSYIIV